MQSLSFSAAPKLGIPLGAKGSPVTITMPIPMLTGPRIYIVGGELSPAPFNPTPESHSRTRPFKTLTTPTSTQASASWKQTKCAAHQVPHCRVGPSPDPCHQIRVNSISGAVVDSRIARWACVCAGHCDMDGVRIWAECAGQFWAEAEGSLQVAFSLAVVFFECFLSVGESRSWNEVCAQVLPCTIAPLSFTLLMLPKLSLVSHNVAELLSSIAAVPRNISSLQKLCLYLFSDCLSQAHRHTAEDGCLCHKDTPRHYLNSCPPTLEKYTSSWE
jgi:hypothetical protein